MSENRRLDQLESLRFAAFLLIFIFHGFGENLSRFHYYTEYGAAEAVSFFFILSGFGTGYGSAGKETVLTPRNLCEDILRKLRKFYPLYVFTIFFCTLFTDLPAVVNLSDRAGLIRHTLSLSKCCLLIQAWFTDFLLYNGVGWFLSALMFLNLFSLPMKCFLNRLSKRKRSGRILIFLTAVCLGLSAMYAFILGKKTDLSYWGYAFPPARLSEYLAGLCFGRFIASVRLPDKRCRRACFTVLELAALCLWIVPLFIPCPAWQMWTVRWLIPNMLLIGIFALGKGLVSRILSWRPFVFMGSLSFECYLLHQIVQVLYIRYTGFENTLSGTAFYVIFTLGITVFLSALIKKGAYKKRSHLFVDSAKNMML